jgi:methionyl-tRNA formyltransferase
LRTVYLGSSRFAVDVLGALATSPHAPALVVTPPDRPRGRGRRTAPPPAAVAARELGITVLQTESVNTPEAQDAIAATEPEAIGVCEFGQLIREPLLSRYLMLNVHPSLLPRWRGAAPIERAMMAGDDVTGVTIFRLDEGFDSGPIALSRAEPILPDDNRETLALRLSALGAELLIEALDRAEAGALDLEPQPQDGVTYAEKISPGDRRLDPARPAEDLERTVRALTPGIGAYVELAAGERLGVEVARRAGAVLERGQVLHRDGHLLIGCADGALELLQVRPAGGRSMPAADYLRGHDPGPRLAGS